MIWQIIADPDSRLLSPLIDKLFPEGTVASYGVCMAYLLIAPVAIKG